jgi:hypothetical protein
VTEITTEIDFVKMAEGIVKLQEGQRRLEEYIIGNDNEDGLCKRVKTLENGMPKVIAFSTFLGIIVGSVGTFVYQFLFITRS